MLTEIQNWLRRRPFVPFRIHLQDGTSHDVQHRELAAVGYTSMMVGTPRAGSTEPLYEHFAFVEYARIKTIEPVPAPGANGPGQPT